MGERTSDDTAGTLPRVLATLLGAKDETGRERAWPAFVAAYSRLILHVTRSLGGDHDAVMDRYTYVLDRLRQDDCRRLHRYAADGRGKFTTWLTVVVRRLALDHHRERYGRARGAARDESATVERTARRRLVDLLGERLDLARIADPVHTDPERELARRELARKLTEAANDLEPRDRLLLTLRFCDDLSARAIVDAMGFPSPFHVYRRINAVLATLRQTLERSGVDSPDA